MSLRKVWLFVLIAMTTLVIGINAIVLTSLTDQYFTDYLKESYELHIGQIIEYIENALRDKEYTYKRMSIDLETHLNDPIIGLKLYNPQGELLLSVSSDYYKNEPMDSMMGGRGMMGMMSGDNSETIEQYDIHVDGDIVAVLNVSLHSGSENSFVAMRFQKQLLMNSLLSIGLAVLLSIIIGIFISRWMSKSLLETKKLATDIQLGEKIQYKKTFVREIAEIRESLLDLNVRLKLKQKTRKSLTDQLVHQTRTPLTILKSHIEAYEDGVLDMDAKELSVCKNQIDNMTYIITNMSAMIDAEVSKSNLQVTEFEFSKVLKQIITGLKPQFEKKQILLSVESDTSIKIVTDKDLLSQSIYNVLTNAYKYTEASGQVRVRYTIEDNQLHIMIQDNGVGIKEEDIHKIFDAYFRSSNVTSLSGEGIGLYFTKENIEMIGGTIDVSSEVNSGSSFTIKVPIFYVKE